MKTTGKRLEALGFKALDGEYVLSDNILGDVVVVGKPWTLRVQGEDYRVENIDQVVGYLEFVGIRESDESKITLPKIRALGFSKRGSRFLFEGRPWWLEKGWVLHHIGQDNLYTIGQLIGFLKFRGAYANHT